MNRRGCGCCGGVINTRCVGGCGWWIEATAYADACLGDFVIEFELSGGVTASKDGATRRTSDPAVFIVPTTNGTEPGGDYTITYEWTYPRWKIVGPGVNGYINYPLFGAEGCSLAGTFIIDDVTIDFEVVAEECPECCGVDGIDDYPCGFRPEAITNFIQVLCDGQGNSSTTITQNGDSFFTTQASNCSWQVPVITDDYPPVEGEQNITYDSATGSWNVFFTALDFWEITWAGTDSPCTQSLSIIHEGATCPQGALHKTTDFDVAGFSDCDDPIPTEDCAAPLTAMAARTAPSRVLKGTRVVRNESNLPMLKICRECEHWGNRKETGCGSTGCLLSPTKPCDIGFHLKKGHGCFAESPKFGPTWLANMHRDVSPDNCMVISGANTQFIRGTYFLAWTLLRFNDVRMTVYLDGVADDDPHVEQMRSWGIEFKELPLVVPSDVPWSQTWNKPACILDAMKQADKVLWIDSDAAIAWSIAPAFDLIGESLFVPDHGNCKASKDNDEIIHQILGEPKRVYVGTERPCAGIVGVDSTRDADLVNEWSQRCLKISKHPDLWLDGRESPLKFYDQGVLMDLLTCDTADGHVWNELNPPRQTSISNTMQHLAQPNSTRIAHFGGKVKPWFGWAEILRWGDPRS